LKDHVVHLLENTMHALAAETNLTLPNSAIDVIPWHYVAAAALAVVALILLIVYLCGGFARLKP
jgi:hypothetical protein